MERVFEASLVVIAWTDLMFLSAPPVERPMTAIGQSM
jgi:hypothetical protein